MQLDRTRIVVRQRDFADLLDLALGVIRGQFGGLMLWLAVGVVPMVLLDAWLLAGFVDTMMEEPSEAAALYVWFLIALIVCQEPIATAPLTLYLGRTMFLERPRPRRISADWLRCIPQLLLLQVLPRLVVSPCVPLSVLLVAVRPHTAEVILLERTPLRARRGKGPTTWTRSGRLHGPAAGEVLARVLLCALVGFVLALVFWPTFGFVHSSVLGASGYWYWMWLIYLPSSIWLATGFLVVVRFLSYLDLRIRQEGWDLELQFRAEASRAATSIG